MACFWRAGAPGKSLPTNIPDLWLLEDPMGMGSPKKGNLCITGLVLAWAFIMICTGCIWPDGRLYFSIGDRGSCVQTRDGRIVGFPIPVVSFAVSHGSHLEVYAHGRNSQELAFDAHGNLFTGDNNSDGGDQARWVYLVPGGDSG